MVRKNLRVLIRLAVAAPLFLIAARSAAQSPQIAEVKVRLFFQYSGEFSPLLSENDVLWNVMAGGGNFAEPANSAFVDITVSDGAKTHIAKPVVNLVVTNARTGKVVERQSGQAGVFGPSSLTHVGFWVRSINCEPLVFVASISGSSKSLSLPFRCGE